LKVKTEGQIGTFQEP